MKKETIRGAVVLAIVVVIWLLIAFLIPFVKTATFWASLIFGIAAIAVAALAIYISLVKAPDTKSKFYGFPIARIGVIYGIAQLAVGLLFMALASWIPAWAAVLLYAIALGAALIGLISAETVVEEIKIQDEKLKKDVSVMRSLQAKVNQIAAHCDNAGTKSELDRLNEQFRYSDPVSGSETRELEDSIGNMLSELEPLMVSGADDAQRALIKKISATLGERNSICKAKKE